MTRRHFEPKLNKKRVLTHGDCTAYSVNAFAVRNAARPDEEFGNFATNGEFPDLIPRGEIWVSEKLVPREGVFFVANALTRLARRDAGATDKAYTDGIETERQLRERITGLAFRDGKPHAKVPPEIYLEEYITLPDPRGPVVVWLIRGDLARDYYKTDYTQGGHDYVYPWVPKGEIWVEDGADRHELPFIVCHEYLERRLMRDAGLDYDGAHVTCSGIEFGLRKAAGATPLLTGGRRKIGKRDLPGLTSEEMFSYAVEQYARGAKS
jgi:hypothetical protein